MKEKNKAKKEEREMKAHRTSHGAQGGKRDDADGSVSGQAVEDEMERGLQRRESKV